MQSPYSRLAYIAITKELTENVAVKPATFIPFLSESIMTEYEPTPIQPIAQSRNRFTTAIPQAISAPQGTISMFAEPKTMGHFLNGIYGQGVSGVYLPISTVSGNFAVGETLTGSVSSKTAVVKAVDTDGEYLIVDTPSGDLSDGETLTGGTSSATATLTKYASTVFGHEFIAPQDELPTYTLEIGYKDRAKRLTGVRFNSLEGLGQSDNVITFDVGVIARAEFLYGKVTEVVLSGSGSKTIKVDQTLGLVAGDTIKVFRPSDGEYKDFSANGVITHTVDSVDDKLTFKVTDLHTALAVGDQIVLAPQTATYSVAREFTWIGGSEIKLGDHKGTLTGFCAEDFTMQLLNEIEPRHCGNGILFEDRFPAHNFMKSLEASGSIQQVYQNPALLGRLRDNVNTSLSVKHHALEIGSTGMNYTVYFKASKVQFNNFNVNIGEDELLEQDINYTVYTDTPFTHKAVLVNDVASY